jgi:UDP-N-acetylmuramoylalanine--D-glutamate ligase
MYITVADKDREAVFPVLENDPYVNWIYGEDYLSVLEDYDVVLKSPGISLKDVPLSDTSKISSQTDLFLQAFAPQCIGITGTKGKSTTASLLYHVLRQTKRDVLLAGNIGVPFFDIVDDIRPSTKIVLELSSHQLEYVSTSPHISVLLNIFEEHLDHYRSFAHYGEAKFNIARRQKRNDFFIYNTVDEQILKLSKEQNIQSKSMGFSFEPNEKSVSYVRDACFYVLKEDNTEEKIAEIREDFPLKGKHNLQNVAAAIAALQCLGTDNERIEKAIYSFKGLEHRLERVGEFGGIVFYNDSISTVPQASIAAIEALKNVDTIILGGFDRGIDYRFFVDFLENSDIRNFIFTGEAGQRMMKLFPTATHKNLYFKEMYPEIVKLAKTCTQEGKICLLSPAAASYDQFKNFEHRGKKFKELLSANQ